MDLDPSNYLESVMIMQLFPLQDDLGGPPALGTIPADNSFFEDHVQGRRLNVGPAGPHAHEQVPTAMADTLINMESTPEPSEVRPRSVARRTALESSFDSSLHAQSIQSGLDPAPIAITAGLPFPANGGVHPDSGASPLLQPGGCIDPALTVRGTTVPAGPSGKRRRDKDDPNKTNTPAQGSSRHRQTTPSKRRRVSAPIQPATPKAPLRKNSRPPRGHLRYSDRSKSAAREKSKSPSPDDSPHPPFSELALKALAELDDEVKPIRLVSIRSIDKSKCMTRQQIIGYDPAVVTVKDQPIASISCAIEDEKLGPRAQADFNATRARLNVRRDFVKPPENAVTNIVNADMTPKQAEAAIKASRVAMREAKQTQAMLMFAMDMSHNRPRPSRLSFMVPSHESVYTVRLDKSDAPDDGTTSALAGSVLASQQTGALPHVTAGTYRVTDSDISHSRDSSLSDSSTSASGSSFSSVRHSMGSDASSEANFTYPLSHAVAPPVPAYNFAIPNFSIPGVLNPGAGTALDPLPSTVPADDNGISAGPNMTWDATLHQQAANMLSSFQMPASTLPGADNPTALNINATYASEIPNSNSIQQNALNAFSFDQLFAPSSLSNLSIGPGTFLSSLQSDFLPPPPVLQPYLDTPGTTTATPLPDGISNPVFPASRPRTITATGIERLLGSATIADHTRALPEPAMNPCALYPPGSMIGHQEWQQQQRFIGLIDAEPQMLPLATATAMPQASTNTIQINGASAALSSLGGSSTVAAPNLSANALGKRKSVVEETESGDGWTSAYPPPLPGGRGTKKRGRPRSRSDIPPKPKLNNKPVSAFGSTANSDGENPGPIVYGPELPPGVKKDVPIAAPSSIPLRICAPVPRRGVGRFSTQYPFDDSSSTSESTQESAQAAQAAFAQTTGQTYLAPPSEELDSVSTSTTPRPTNQTRLRSATIPAMGGSSFFDLLGQQGDVAQLPATYPPSAMMDMLATQTDWVPAPMTGIPGPSHPLSFGNVPQRDYTSLTSDDGRRSSTSSVGGQTSSSGSGTTSSSRPGTGMTVASSSSTGSGEIMFVNYGMEDANVLRRGVAPSGNYKVPLPAKKRKMP